MWIDEISCTYEAYIKKNHRGDADGFPMYDSSYGFRYFPKDCPMMKIIGHKYHVIFNSNLSHMENKKAILSLLESDLKNYSCIGGDIVDIFADRQASNEPLYVFVIMLSKICRTEPNSPVRKKMIESLLSFLAKT